MSVYLISKGSVGTLSYSLVVQCDWFRKSEKTCILRVYNISSSARVKLYSIPSGSSAIRFLLIWKRETRRHLSLGTSDKQKPCPTATKWGKNPRLVLAVNSKGKVAAPGIYSEAWKRSTWLPQQAIMVCLTGKRANLWKNWKHSIHKIKNWY